jgi:hypothetical protein
MFAPWIFSVATTSSPSVRTEAQRRTFSMSVYSGATCAETPVSVSPGRYFPPGPERER